MRVNKPRSSPYSPCATPPHLSPTDAPATATMMRRSYRLYDHGPTFRYETKQNMLDGTLLWRFVGLDAKTQHDLTRAIGTTVDRVMANLLDIDLASLF